MTRLRRWAALVGGAGWLLSASGGCGDFLRDDDLDFTARAGEPCDDCDECNNMVSICDCKTCTDYALSSDDPTIILNCTGIWTERYICVGGASVSCVKPGEGGYLISCLDEAGNEISRH